LFAEGGQISFIWELVFSFLEGAFLPGLLESMKKQKKNRIYKNV